MTPLEFASAMLAYCAYSRGSVPSWLRSAERNSHVGGHPQSKHVVGLAADIGYHPNPRPPLAQARKRASQLGLKLIREGDHDHLQSL